MGIFLYCFNRMKVLIRIINKYKLKTFLLTILIVTSTISLGAKKQVEVNIGFIDLTAGAFSILKSYEKELKVHMTLFTNMGNFQKDTLTDLSKCDLIYIYSPPSMNQNNIWEKYKNAFENAVNKNPDIKFFLSSEENSYIWQDGIDKGIVKIDSNITLYYKSATKYNESLKNMVKYILITYFKRHGKFTPPSEYSLPKMYHPDYGEFNELDKFLSWSKRKGWNLSKCSRVVINTHYNFYKFSQISIIDSLIKGFEKQNILAICFIKDMPGFEERVFKFKPDVILQTCDVGNYNEKFWKKAGVPRIHAIYFYRESIDEWQKSLNSGRPQGEFITGELTGATEFLASGGPEHTGIGEEYFPIPERITHIINRTKAWINLQHLENSQKKIAFVYYDEEVDKSGLMRGTSSGQFINAPRSMVKLLKIMKEKGYNISKIPSDEDELLGWLMDRGRQMGVWEQGTLDKIARSGKAVLIPEERYLEWFKEKVPKWKQEQVIKQWGMPPGNFMVWENKTERVKGKKYIVIPWIDLGNIILLPQPIKGKSQTATMANAIAHDTRNPPPHNYLATYFWLQEEIKPDAFVHFGTHGTEWLFAGKPELLSQSDWSDMLIGNIPNINPWIINNVGEIIPCRRRGMAVLVSLLTPPLMNAGLSDELLNLKSSIQKWEMLENGALKQKFAVSITKQVKKVNIDKDLEMNLQKGQILRKGDMERLENYLEDIQNEVVCSGLHTFGKEPSDTLLVPYLVHCMGKKYIDASREIFKVPSNADSINYLKTKTENILNMILYEDSAFIKVMQTVGNEKENDSLVEKVFVEAIKRAGGNIKNDSIPEKLKERLEVAVELNNGLKKSHMEIDNLLNALDGKFIPPGPSGTPERNPSVVPTGRNMYAMNPDEVPTRESWELGTQLIKDYLEKQFKETGKYPREVAFRMFSSASFTDYGIIESQLLYLMGVRPIWDSKNLVNDIELIPAEELGRPRIDVFLAAKSYYRDQLPTRMKLLDKAIRLVASLKEKDNYLYDNSVQIKKDLEKQGKTPEEAEILSKARIFSVAPGAMADPNYNSLVPRSGEWDKKEDLVNVYKKHCSYVYTEGMWGVDAPETYNETIKKTDLILKSWSDATLAPLAVHAGWQEVGVMSLVVKQMRGKEPDYMYVDVRDADNAAIVSDKEVVQKDFRARFLNPKWIKEMMKEGYGGAASIEMNMENVINWEIMRDKTITDENWKEIYDVYVRDSKNLNLRKWFESMNPYAFQEMMVVFLETIRKGYWNAPPEVRKEIVMAYAESVGWHGKVGGLREGGNKKLKNFIEKSLSDMHTKRAEELLKLYREKSFEMEIPDLEPCKGCPHR